MAKEYLDAYYFAAKTGDPNMTENDLAEIEVRFERRMALTLAITAAVQTGSGSAIR